MTTHRIALIDIETHSNRLTSVCTLNRTELFSIDFHYRPLFSHTQVCITHAYTEKLAARVCSFTTLCILYIPIYSSSLEDSKLNLSGNQMDLLILLIMPQFDIHIYS